MVTLGFDLETNGLNPSEIYIVGVLDYDSDEFTAYMGDDVPEGLLRCASADRVFGHNVKGYDIPHVERLTNGLIKFDRSKVDDTCEISKALFPTLANHKLKLWGEIFGYPKIEYNKGFDRFHPDMVPYCERDVRLNKVLYDFLLEQIRNGGD